MNKTKDWPKMALSVESLNKLYSDLENREIRWDEACKECRLPKLIHMENMICRKVPDLELDPIWDGFRMIMGHIRNEYKDKMEKMQMDSNFTQELKEHEQTDQKWKCDLCEKQHTSIEELEEHKYDYHEHKCNRCEKRYVHIKELSEHLKKEHEIMIQRCRECGKEFESLEELSEHVKNCYTCGLCDYGIGMNRRDFENHIDMRHHKRCYTCDQCKNWYEDREDLEDHKRRRHTKYNCDQCDN